MTQLPLLAEGRTPRDRVLVGELLRSWSRVKSANFREWIFSEEAKHECYNDFIRRPVPGRLFEEHAPLLMLALTELEVSQGRYKVDEHSLVIRMRERKIT